MDSELKRRLVGTLIIVSLVVIFVPMLFEEKDDLTQDSGDTSIPEFPRDFDSQVIPLPGAAPEQSAGGEPALEAPGGRRDDARDPLDIPASKTPDTAEEESAAPQAAGADADEEDLPAPPAPARPGAAPVMPAAKPGVKPPAEPAAKTARPASEPIPPGKAPSLQAPAPKQAIPPRPVKKKTVTTTALPKPAAADAKPVPAAKSAPAPGAAPAGETANPVKGTANLSWWMIQAGSFDDEANARNLKTRLLQAKIPAFSEKITAPDGVVKYRVRVGPEKERAKAEDILRRMEGEAGVKGMIVSYP